MLSIRGIDESQTAIIGFESPSGSERVSLFVFTQKCSFYSAKGRDAFFLHTLDQIVVTGDIAVKLGKGHSYIFFFVRIRAAETLLAVFFCQQLGNLICMDGFTSIEAFQKIKLSD